MNAKNELLAVIGLGYVGLPLAVAFGRARRVIGFDIEVRRIGELSRGYDRTKEVSSSDILGSNVDFSVDPSSMAGASVFIVTTPTPVDEHKRPDLTAVLAATKSVAAHISPGSVVIYESTVYPGATEEVCVPVLEAVSGLQYNSDFFVGYSPERINPGDREHHLDSIVKVTSGSTPETADFVDQLYRTIITAGTHRAPSIRVAEAAKVIENTQRDVNIALVNELAILFGRLGIDTGEVLEAAGSKWNFLGFRPGLVGGHCIGVDPYYLTHKAQALGFHPEMILAGRRINDAMGSYVSQQLIKSMLRCGTVPTEARVLILGLAFKENIPDLRNSRVVDVVNELQDYGILVDVYDPLVNVDEARDFYGISLIQEPESGVYRGIVVAVAHDEFRDFGSGGLRRFAHSEGCVVYDLKNLLPRSESTLRL